MWTILRTWNMLMFLFSFFFKLFFSHVYFRWFIVRLTTSEWFARIIFLYSQLLKVLNISFSTSKHREIDRSSQLKLLLSVIKWYSAARFSRTKSQLSSASLGNSRQLGKEHRTLSVKVMCIESRKETKKIYRSLDIDHLDMSPKENNGLI